MIKYSQNELDRIEAGIHAAAVPSGGKIPKHLKDRLQCRYVSTY